MTEVYIPLDPSSYPTGPFAFLPIHAAGILVYDNEGGERVSDYVVSSYTPTLSALLSPLPPPTNNFKMLAVIQPHAAGYSSLPSTYRELLRIESRVPEECLVKLGIPGALATVENVLSHLSTISIVHLACHGVQDTKNPFESMLILGDDERLKISRIMEQPMPNASLAFLSACETAMGDEDLPDEAIHLAASLLFAGFRGVVATMWWASGSLGDRRSSFKRVSGQWPTKMDQRLQTAFMDSFSKTPQRALLAGALIQLGLLGRSTWLLQICV